MRVRVHIIKKLAIGVKSALEIGEEPIFELRRAEERRLRSSKLPLLFTLLSKNDCADASKSQK